MKQFKQFQTRGAANQGVKLPLKDSDGNDTEHFIKMLGTDSDAFRKAKYEGKQELMDLMSSDTEIDYEVSHRINIKVMASLISSWSFTNEDETPYPCTLGNVIKFLIECPQIADNIDSLAADREVFMKRKSKLSAKPQEKDLHSTGPKKELTKPGQKPSSKSGKQLASVRKG